MDASYRQLLSADPCWALLVCFESASVAHSAQPERAQGHPAAAPAAGTAGAPAGMPSPVLQPAQLVLNQTGPRALALALLRAPGADWLLLQQTGKGPLAAMQQLLLSAVLKVLVLGPASGPMGHPLALALMSGASAGHALPAVRAYSAWQAYQQGPLQIVHPDSDSCLNRQASDRRYCAAQHLPQRPLVPQTDWQGVGRLCQGPAGPPSGARSRTGAVPLEWQRASSTWHHAVGSRAVCAWMAAAGALL